MKDVFKLLVRLGHYIFEACGAGPFCGFCKLLGYHLSGLSSECSPMKHTKSQSPQSKSSGSGHAKPGSSLALLGSVRPSGTSSMCTFQHNFSLGGLSKLLAELSAELSAEPMISQLVSSVVSQVIPHAKPHSTDRHIASPHRPLLASTGIYEPSDHVAHT